MLIQLLREELKENQNRIIVATVLSGITNAGILAITHLAARTPQHPSMTLLFMFVVACILFAVSLRYSVNAFSSIIEAVIYKRRLSVADKLTRAELLTMEQIGTSQIYERLTQETAAISQAAMPITATLQAVVAVVFVVLYLLYLSPTAFVLTLAFCGAGTAIYYARDLRAQELMREATHVQVSVYDRLTDLLKGFKELRLNTRRRAELFKDFQLEARLLEAKAVETNVVNLENFILFQLNSFVLLAVVVFVVPQYSAEHSSVLNQLIAVVLFLFGAIGNGIYGLPQFSRASFAAEQIFELEQKLEQIDRQKNEAHLDPWGGRFTQLSAEGVEFRYETTGEQQSFAIGPLSLSVRAGEILFVVGGNGSGKSTLIKVLTALYAPTVGSLKVDGVPVTAETAQAYREMISAILTDFHLFKKLYGLTDVSSERVQSLLEQMEIANKTTYSQGSFSTIELSTGQRKRLAMVIALLEDRPIYVLDEWAADQEPAFRRYFYEELLQDLKRRGKAVIAISHDDRYFHCADRVLVMEEGQLREAKA